MTSRSYSFIDIAALDKVREKFAGGAAIAVVTTDLETTIWANGPGAALFGHDDVESLIGSKPEFGKLALRQLRGLHQFPNIRDNSTVALRIESGLKSRAVVLQASHLVLSPGEDAIMLAADPSPSERTIEARAKNAIAGFTRQGHCAAYIGETGNIVARTDGFDELNVPADVIAGLVEEVAGEQDRLVKRLIPVSGGHAPAGIVRLADDPGEHLLVVVADSDSIGRWEKPASQSDTVAPAIEQTVPEAGLAPAGKAEKNAQPAKDSDEQDEAGEMLSPTDLEARQSQTRNANGTGASKTAHYGTIPDTAPVESTSGSPSGHATKVPSYDRPVRFVWKTDTNARIVEISDEFVEAFGKRTGSIGGTTFAEIAAGLDLDPKGEIAALLKRRDTWSGRSVLWPVSETDMQVPVDLAALPVYNRDREFKGFRGFGVARMSEIQPDPAERGKKFKGFVALREEETGGRDAQADPPREPRLRPNETPARRRPAVAANDDPFHGEVPAISISRTPMRRRTDKIIGLQQKRKPGDESPPETIEQSGLSDEERSAFRQIADRLKRETEEVPAAPRPFGRRQRPPEKQEQRADKTLLETGSGQSGGPVGEGTADHREEEQAVEAPVEHAAPEALPNPVPSAFAGLSSLFRSELADTDVLMQLPVPIMIYNDAGIRFANSALLKLAGYEDIESLNNEGGVDALFAQDEHGGKPDVVPGDSMVAIVTSAGEEIPVDAHLHRIYWNGELSLVLSIRAARGDNGEQEASGMPDSILQARVDELVSILDTATDGVVTISPDMLIRSVNRSAEALFGYDGREIVGKPFADLFATESRQVATDYVSGLSEVGVASLLNDGREVIGREAHGRFIPLFMTVGRLAGSAGYCAVLRDITHWKKAENELTEARRIAERSSSQKTEFLARISHEIRTPLNAIIGFSELMLDEKFGPIANERYRDYLKDINRSGNHVLDLVNDLLDISKIEAGEMELDNEAVHLNDALAEAIAMMQPLANRERVIVRSSLASGLPDVVADLRSVRQIALNLLSNAIRYTLAGGQVIVSTAYEADGSVVIRVRDTGVGMSQAEISQALKPFRQISALKRSRDRGTGLGLPLTKAMVEANRAQFNIKSAPGEGTLVEVVFPPTRVLAD